MRNSLHFFLFILVSISLVSLTRSYLVTVDVNNEECFYERMSNHDKLGIVYDVIDGGFLDIGFRVIGPDVEVIYDNRKTSSTGRYTFCASKSGPYIFCFINKHTSATPKDVKFMLQLHNSTTNNAKIKLNFDDDN